MLNLGTPKTTAKKDVKAYLREFLSDRRVVGLPAWLWQPILRGIILQTRPAKSAAKYADIWMEEGSPLLVYGRALSQAVGQQLEGISPDSFVVDIAMRYGQPNIAEVLDAWLKQGIERILVIPLYPQYSSSTTASALDAVSRWSQKQSRVPEFRFLNNYHNHQGYIQALAACVKNHWTQNKRKNFLLISFHGLPKKMIDCGDPYEQQCIDTANLLGQALELKPSQYEVSFQIRFGNAKWIEPSTSTTLKHLAQQGLQSVDVICPGFATDCLETLEEINVECKNVFLHHGGKDYRYIPCLNAQPLWVNVMVDMIKQHTLNWG